MADLNKIQFKRTKTPGLLPTTDQLAEGELAINLVDRSIYTSDGSTIISLGFAKGGQVDGDIEQVSGSFTTRGNISTDLKISAKEISLLDPVSVENGGTGKTNALDSIGALGQGLGIGEREISIIDSIDMQQFVFISGSTYQCYFENILNAPESIKYTPGTLVNIKSSVNDSTISLFLESLNSEVYNSYSVEISNAKNKGLRSFKTRRYQNSTVIIPESEGGTGANNFNSARLNLNAVSRSGDTISGDLKLDGKLNAQSAQFDGLATFNNHELNCVFKSNNSNNVNIGINYTDSGSFGFVDATNGFWQMRRDYSSSNWFFHGNIGINSTTGIFQGSVGGSDSGFYLNNGKTGKTFLLQNDGNLTYDNNTIYHSGNRPAPSDINAVNKSGDTMSGQLNVNANIVSTVGVTSPTVAINNGGYQFNFTNNANGTLILNRANISTLTGGQIGLRNFGAVHVAGSNGGDGSLQGTHLLWNEEGDGKGSIIVNKGLGSGGFNFRFVNSSGGEEARIRLSNTGHGRFPGGLTAGQYENALSGNSITIGDSYSGVVGPGGPIQIYANNQRIAHFDTGQCYFDKNVQASAGVYVNGGDLYQTNDSYSTYVRDIYIRSDIRVKRNLKLFESASEKLSKIGGYTYEQKRGHNEKGIDNYVQSAGLIAQEVQSVLPELVSEDPGEDKLLRLNYNGVIGLNTAAINEHTKTINDLKEEVKNLKYIIEAMLASDL